MMNKYNNILYVQNTQRSLVNQNFTMTIDQCVEEDNRNYVLIYFFSKFLVVFEIKASQLTYVTTLKALLIASHRQ